ncbi:MAG: family NAD(P)-dependent oxidoreductase [Bacteroidetes bacterium]|nr:family NAD(P)-dependent oxidoreductase [Bacteroidota bacterium]
MGVAPLNAIVTGGAGALGVVVVRRFALAGVRVAVPVRHQASGPGPESGGVTPGVLHVGADLSDETAVSTFVGRVERELGPVDILVNLAGGYAGGASLEKVTVGEWDSMLSMNLRTAFLMTRAVVGGMKSRKFGRIVSIAASAALAGGARRIPYAVSKAGVAALTRDLAVELKGTGVTANAIAPSIILTDSNRRSMPTADVSAWVTPEEIASAIEFFCSREARSVSGNILMMYGGV